MEDASSGVNEQGKRFRLALLYAVLFLLLMGGVSIGLWGIPDPKIMYVPVPILQWAFTGGMVAVLYRLAYHRKIDLGEADLYVWVIAKPVIGMVMGAMVYFFAVSGELFLNGRTEIHNIHNLRGEWSPEGGFGWVLHRPYTVPPDRRRGDPALRPKAR